MKQVPPVVAHFAERLGDRLLSRDVGEDTEDQDRVTRLRIYRERIKEVKDAKSSEPGKGPAASPFGK